jgi:hypothetical protein
MCVPPWLSLLQHSSHNCVISFNQQKASHNPD